MTKYKTISKATFLIDRKAPNSIFLDAETLNRYVDHAAAEEEAFAEFEAEREESILWVTLSDLGWSPREINEIIRAYEANPNMTVRTAHGLATSFA